MKNRQHPRLAVKDVEGFLLLMSGKERLQHPAVNNALPVHDPTRKCSNAYGAQRPADCLAVKMYHPS
jgi:hypothetical protein